MHDVDRVEGLESTHDLDEQVPDLRLWKHSFVCLMLHDLLVQITIVRIFHHNAKRIVVFVYENLFVGDDIGVVDTCKNSDFIDSIWSFFLAEVVNSDFFQRVKFLIGLSLHMIYTWISPRS